MVWRSKRHVDNTCTVKLTLSLQNEFRFMLSAENPGGRLLNMFTHMSLVRARLGLEEEKNKEVL